MVVSLHGHQMPEQVRAARLLDVYEHEGISASRVERDIGQRSRLNLTVGSSARDGERSVRESLSGQATGVQPLEALLRMPECSPEEETDGRQEHGKYHHQLLRLHAMSQYSRSLLITQTEDYLWNAYTGHSLSLSSYHERPV